MRRDDVHRRFDLARYLVAHAATIAHEPSRRAGDEQLEVVGRGVDVQPWLAGEWWNARRDVGSYRAARVGLTWFLRGHAANVKVGYEHLVARAPIEPSVSRRWHTVTAAMFFWF